MSDASLPEKLLSAFADGQLTGPEKARAERLIAENPHYAELVEQWRAQGQLMRDLPRYRLDRDFSDRVMAKFNLEKSTHESVTTSTSEPVPSTSWDARSAGAALLALAAMILLTLFVFPNGVTNLEVARVAEPAKSSRLISPPQGAVDESDLESEAQSSADALKSGDGSLQVGANPVPAEPTSRDDDRLKKSNEMIESDSGGLAELAQAPVSTQQKSAQPAEVAETAENKAKEIPTQSEQLADNEDGQPSGIDREPARNLKAADSVALKQDVPKKGMESFASVLPVQNVAEVWLVDMKGPNSHEKLQAALQKNQITIQTNQRSQDFAAESIDLSRTEVMQVLTSESQIRGAIVMLAEDADISSYPIPLVSPSDDSTRESQLVAGQNGQFSAPPAAGVVAGSTAHSISRDLYLPKDSDHSTKINKLVLGNQLAEMESRSQSANDQGSNLADTGVRSESATAQSRQPVTVPPLAEGGLAPNDSARGLQSRKLAAKETTESLPKAGQVDQETESEKEWYEVPEEELAGGSGIGGASRQPSPFVQEEMRQYLLLIRFEPVLDRVEASEEEVAPADKQ